MDSPRRSPGTKPGFKNGRIKKITHNYASGNTLSAIMVVRAWKVAWAARTAGDLTKVLCRIHSAAIRSRRRPRTATLPPLGIPVRSLLGNLVRHLWSVWPIHPHLSHFSEVRIPHSFVVFPQKLGAFWRFHPLSKKRVCQGNLIQDPSTAKTGTVEINNKS